MQSTSTILMIRPVKFAFNKQTAGSNAFQKGSKEQMHIQATALSEFNTMVKLLQENEVEVIVIEDTPEPHTPDSIFPNNWFSTDDDGDLFIYPMEAENRRMERRKDIVNQLRQKFLVRKVVDISAFEKENKFLEGTGSMVLDRHNKIVYACLSSRTHDEMLHVFSEHSGYDIVSFHAYDNNKHPIYHTNVLMCMGDKFSVICLNAISSEEERHSIEKSLKKTGKEIIAIDLQQMNNFAGNMLMLKNKREESLIIMSSRAFQSLQKDQIERLSKYGKILHSPLTVIENNGGGSARCMMAEIFLPERKVSDIKN